jgi:hypothetical protein
VQALDAWKSKFSNRRAGNGDLQGHSEGLNNLGDSDPQLCSSLNTHIRLYECGSVDESTWYKISKRLTRAMTNGITANSHDNRDA